MLKVGPLQNSSGSTDFLGSLQHMLTGIQLVIPSALCQELLMVAELDDLTGLDDRDLIGIPNGGKAMGDDEYGLAVHQAVQALLDFLLREGRQDLL